MRQLHEQIVELYQQTFPLTYDKIFSKRIVPPNGYMSNIYYKACMFSPFMMFQSDRKPDGDTSNAAAMYLTSLAMIRLGFPTYHISDAFCDAVFNTDPPDDMTMAGVHWPLDAMLFMLPIQWVHDNFGANVLPRIGVIHAPRGAASTERIEHLRADYAVRRLFGIDNTEDRFIFTWSDVYMTNIGKWSQMDHDGVYRSTHTVKQIQEFPAVSKGHYWKAEGDDGYSNADEERHNLAIRRFVTGKVPRSRWCCRRWCRTERFRKAGPDRSRKRPPKG